MILVFRRSALRDLRRIALWYRTHRLPPYEARFFERLRVTLQAIVDSPEGHEVLFEDIGVRRARIHRTPYGIVHAIRDSGIRVVAILHGALSQTSVSRRVRTRDMK